MCIYANYMYIHTAISFVKSEHLPFNSIPTDLPLGVQDKVNCLSLIGNKAALLIIYRVAQLLKHVEQLNECLTFKFMLPVKVFVVKVVSSHIYSL